MTKYSKYNLSNRQSDVLDCLIEGWTTKKIASTLYITDRTVQTHLKAIYKKLQVKTRTEATSLILRDSEITTKAIEIPPVPVYNYTSEDRVILIVDVLKD